MYEAGDVVLVPFPYSDRFAEKRRPALIVARPRIAEAEVIYWLAMVTSAKQTSWLGDVPIDDLSAAGVHGPCVVRSAKIATLEIVRIVKKIGQVSSSQLLSVQSHARRELTGHPA